MSPREPPFDPYSPTDKESFSYDTVVKRWPVILTGVVDNIHNLLHDLAVSPPPSPIGLDSTSDDPVAKKIAEGKLLIAQVSELKYDMSRDRPLKHIPDDGGYDIPLYNKELDSLSEKGLGTWFTAPWLFAECYLYRLLRAWLAVTTQWSQHDPFFLQKLSTFEASGVAVFKLAVTMAELDTKASKETLDKEALEVLFDEMVQMCLWGNATDLSLLPTMDYASIQKLQSVGKAAQAESAEFILRNDIKEAWHHVSKLEGARIDIVLDNSGFELFTDLVLADFLVTHTHFVSKVVFHPKLIPWFVSDVLPPDFAFLLAPSPPPTPSSDAPAPSWRSFFSSSQPSPSANEISALDSLLARWRSLLSSGKFELSVPVDREIGVGKEEGTAFWTLPYSYWKIAESEGKFVLNSLKHSGLVIFKGDLNYRKLTADVKWPPETPFLDSIGSLGGQVPLLSIRTCKADVVVGIPADVADSLDKDEKEKGWRTNGKYGLISFSNEKLST